MDTSETYIKMCEKAVEIQKYWMPAIGDYAWRKYTIFGEEIDRKIWPHPNQSIEIIILHYKSQVDGYSHACNEKGEERIFRAQEEIDKVTSVWLPRQDQLQEMVEEIKDKNHFIFRFYRFLQSKYLKITAQNAYIYLYNTFDGCSMEKLWLCFVMKEKYGKAWDREDWKSEKKRKEEKEEDGE